MSSPLRCAILMPAAQQRGGAEMLLRTLMQHGRHVGVEWHVVFFEDGPMVDEFDALGVDTHVLRVGRLREVGRYVRSVQALVRLIRDDGIDVVFSWMSKAHLYGGVAAWCAGRPALWYQHGLPSGEHPIDRLATLLPAVGVVACSQQAATMQRGLWPWRTVEVAHPCVNLDRFDPDALPPTGVARAQLGLSTRGPVVGMVGRLQRWKGMHVLVDAAPAIRAAHPDAQIVLVGGRHDGEPDYADALDAQIDALGLSDAVHCVGFQSNVPTWMQAMDVVVHASDHEPFGMVVVEAMALGKPVVAGADGGPREIITPEVDGLLAPYGDADALAKQVNRFLSDAAFARACGDAAHRRAHDFSPRQYAEDLVDSLRRLTASPVVVQ